MSDDNNNNPIEAKDTEEVIVSLDWDNLKARIWEATGLDIGNSDPLFAAQVIYVAAMEDQARLHNAQAKRMDKTFSDYLEVFHTETESIVIGIKDEINSQAIAERMVVMSEQIKQADTLASSIRLNARLFRIFTFINFLTLAGALAIFFYVFK